MTLPDFYVEEACKRLRSDLPASDLRRILSLLDLELPEPGSGPDFEDLAEKTRGDPDRLQRGHVAFSGEILVFGETTRVHFRYVYVGEFGFSPDDFEGFGQIEVVARLEVLVWWTDARSPRWAPVDIAVLSPEVMDRVDQLVLEQEQQKSDSQA